MAGVDLLGQPDRPDRGEHEHHEGVAQRPLRAERRGQDRQRRRDAGADHARERDPGVGLDQGQVGRQQAGYGGGARDAVRLGGHQAPERGGEQPPRLGHDGRGQHPAQEAADRHGRADGPPAAVAEAVEERSDQRRDDRERQHRQAEEQRDLAARLAGRDLEEQRAGQRDRHRGVAGGVEGVQLDQPRQPGVAGTLGARRAARLRTRRTGRRCRRPRPATRRDPGRRPGRRARRPTASGGRSRSGAGRRLRPRPRGGSGRSEVTGTILAYGARHRVTQTSRLRVPDGTGPPCVCHDAQVIALPTRAGKPDADPRQGRRPGARASSSRSPSPSEVGDHLGAHAEGERVVTHQFACIRPGYPGWYWSVTLTRAKRGKDLDGQRGRAAARRRRDRGAGLGALQGAAPARRPLARRPAARRGRGRPPGPDLPRRRRPARRRRWTPTPARRCAGSPRTSAWAASAP